MKYHIFDLDGTLADSMPNWQRMMLNILDTTGTRYPKDIIRIITPLGNTGTSNYFINTLHVNATRQELLEMMDAYSLNEYAHNIPIKAGIKEYLEKLKREGNYLGVLTASPHRFTDPCLKNNGVYDLFDAVWSIDDYGTLTKDKTEIYDEMVRRLGCNKEDVVFYDDNIVAVTTAKKANVTTYGVFDKSSENDKDKIKAICDKYIDDFRELV